MRVLLTADSIGGVWTFAVDLARSLDAEVHLATMGGELSDSQRRQAAGLHVYESSYKLEWMPEPWADVDASGEWLLRIESEVRPDVVHLNTLVHGHLPWRAPAVVTAHSCVLSWWEAVKKEPAPAEWNEYQRRVARSLRGAALVTAPSRAMLVTAPSRAMLVTAPSRAMLNDVQRLYGYRGEAAVIPNGRSGQQFRPAAKEPFILAAGRAWDEAKNLAALARVAPRVPWPIHIAGQGSALGPLAPADLARLYSRASIYAWPAKYEPFGLSVLEAALSGCALVLGDIPSLRENWEGAAKFVSTEEELDTALGALIRYPEERGDLGGRAWERAQTFTVERMAKAYGALYETVRALSLCAS